MFDDLFDEAYEPYVPPLTARLKAKIPWQLRYAFSRVRELLHTVEREPRHEKIYRRGRALLSLIWAIFPEHYHEYTCMVSMEEYAKLGPIEIELISNDIDNSVELRIETPWIKKIWVYEDRCVVCGAWLIVEPCEQARYDDATLMQAMAIDAAGGGVEWAEQVLTHYYHEEVGI